MQPNPNPWAPGPVEFTNCTVAEGRDFLTEVIPAVHKWAAHEGEGTGHFMLFPAWGEASDSEYDFKWVSVSSYETLGTSYDDYGQGGGWQKWGELFKGLLECDSPRLYHGMNVREVDLSDWQ